MGMKNVEEYTRLSKSSIEEMIYKIHDRHACKGYKNTQGLKHILQDA